MKKTKISLFKFNLKNEQQQQQQQQKIIRIELFISFINLIGFPIIQRKHNASFWQCHSIDY